MGRGLSFSWVSVVGALKKIFNCEGVLIA